MSSFLPLLIDRLICCLMWLGSPLAPLAAFAASGQIRFILHPVGSIRQSWRHTKAMWRGKVISRAFLATAGKQPADEIEGSCTHCGNCCLFGQCIFLRMDCQGRSSCSVHGRWLWRNLRCSDYPIRSADIELYACPSFRVTTPCKKRVIPVIAKNA
jgi:hypothetical protein